MDGAPHLLTETDMKSDMAILIDKHIITSPLVPTTTACAMACAPRAFPPHHNGSTSTGLQVMPSNPTTEPPSKVRLPTRPHPKGSLLSITATQAERLLLRATLQPPQRQRLESRVEVTPTAIQQGGLLSLLQPGDRVFEDGFNPREESGQDSGEGV